MHKATASRALTPQSHSAWDAPAIRHGMVPFSDGVFPT